MSVIAATVRKSRRWRKCEDCYKGIQQGERYVRAYGYAHPGDKPYAIDMHLNCCSTDTRERIRESDLVTTTPPAPGDRSSP